MYYLIAPLVFDEIITRSDNVISTPLNLTYCLICLSKKIASLEDIF